MSRRGRVIDGPMALVQSLAAGNRGKRRTGQRRGRRQRKSLLLVAASARRNVGAPIKQLSRQQASIRKRRRSLLQRASKRIERISNVVNHVGTLLGVAAAGAELISAVRDHGRDGNVSDTGRPATNGHRESYREEEEVFEGAR